MELNPMQQVMLTVLLGSEDPTAWGRLKKCETARAWHKNNFEKAARRARKWPLDHPEKAKAIKKRWQKNNREKVNAIARVWKHRKFQSDPGFKLKVLISNRIRIALKKNCKSARSEELIGCTISELRGHLETLFVPGMTWANHGPVWHVDHKRPCASFDLSDPAQQRECFHFTNLQPLFAGDNIRKSDSWDGT